jgi:hypothetical protein
MRSVSLSRRRCTKSCAPRSGDPLRAQHRSTRLSQRDQDPHANGTDGPVPLTLPRATLFAGAQEWTSRIVPRYQRRMPEVNEAIVATYLAGGKLRASSDSQGRATLEECGVARDRHAEGRPGGVAEAFAG